MITSQILGRLSKLAQPNQYKVILQVRMIGTLRERLTYVNDYALTHGFKSGIPNFCQKDYGDVSGIRYGAIMIPNDHADWLDVPASVLKDPPTIESRFGRLYDYAKHRGYVGAFPNGHEAIYGDGPIKVKFYGAVLLKSSIAVWRDVSAKELQYPKTSEQRFTAAHDYAKKHGFVGGFPNFYQADYGNGVVYGTILLKDGAEWRDIPLDVLNMYRSYTFDSGIERNHKHTLLERHAFSYMQMLKCSSLGDNEKKQLIEKGYRKNIHHGIETRPGVNASAQINGSSIWVNFGVLFPQGPREIAQTLIHETMHLAGYSHPERSNSDSPHDGGHYYNSPPLRSELCIAGIQSDQACCEEKSSVSDDKETVCVIRPSR